MNLSNNSNEMKTVVETFVIEETAELIYDNEKLDHWNEMVEELGLTGQTKIVKAEKSPIPFMPMNQSLVNIFKTLCPTAVPVQDYNLSPIPVEILDLVALSKREKYFELIEIWYDEKSKDPACVGVIPSQWFAQTDEGNITGNYPTKEAAQAAMDEKGWKKNEPYPSWQKNHYLLGKWADVKHSFEELKEMATKRFIQEQGHQYRKKIKETQRKLDDLESEAFEKFN